MNKNANHIASRARLWAMALCACALGAVLAGCALQGANETADENAAANRQFIAQLNNKTRDLGEVLETFQSAVSAGDAVGMKAASSSARKIADNIEAMKAPKPDVDARTIDSSEDLNEVKDLYAQGMHDLCDAMDDYAEIYAEAASSSADLSGLDHKLSAVQSTYDDAMKKLAEADGLLVDLGKYHRDSSDGPLSDDADESASSSDSSSEGESASSSASSE